MNIADTRPGAMATWKKRDLLVDTPTTYAALKAKMSTYKNLELGFL